MFEKYENEEYINETAEQFNALSKDMAKVELADAGQVSTMVKDATKELGLANVEKKGLKRIPLFAKLSNTVENKLIDTMTAEQVLVKYEKELLELETQAKISKQEIKSGITRNKNIASEVAVKISEVEADIKKLDEMAVNGEQLIEDVPGTIRNRLQSHAMTLGQQKVDAESRTIQYSVQLVLAENILTGFNDVRLSVTTTLRDSIMQAQIIKKQEEYIKSIADAKELMRNVKEDNATRLNTMVNNAAGDIYQYEQDAASIKKITDINYATITSLGELNESIEQGRNLLKDTFIEIEKMAESNVLKAKDIEKVTHSTNKAEQEQFLSGQDLDAIS